MVAGNSSDFSGVSLNDKAEILLLVPNMDTTISTTGVTDTILVKGSTVESSLSVLLSECTILEKLLASISWVPELKRS